MKRKLSIFLCLALLLIGGVLGSKTIIVKASGDYTSTPITLTRVADINVFNDYIINRIPIDTTLTNNQDGGHVYKFTIEKDGFVSMLLAARNVTKNTIVSNSKTTSTLTDAKVTATIYRDSMLLYPVAPSVSALGNTKGESTQKIALDQGTYYVAIQTDKYINTSINGTTTLSFVKGTAEFVTYYQEVNNNEIFRPSNVGKENQVTIESEFTGILTTTNPKDYYRFELTDKALLKINVMYGSKNTAKFALYSTEREELLTKIIAGNSVWYNVEKYLEPGIYYCSLESMTAYDGGLTSILINQTIYPLNLTKINEYTNSYVKVATIDDPKEIRYVLGKLTNSELSSPKWNNGKVITDVLQFGVNKNGYYTVRVTDQYGNMFMQSINITSCDKKAPSNPKIKTYKAGSFVVSGTAEKKSTVTVTINGRAVYTCLTSSKGNYKCTLPIILVKGNKLEVTAQDISGNISNKTEAVVK